jgi:DNA-binding Lrp family transcriptional regulator
MSSEEVFTINGAAKMTGYSLPTIRKRLPQLEKAGAVQIDGRWRIPLSALYACGLMSKVEGFSKATSNPLHSETVNDIETLRAELAEALRRAEVAEAIASERAAALERADRALLAIEASSTSRRARWRLFGSSNAV